jgi:hypothetical protein
VTLNTPTGGATAAYLPIVFALGFIALLIVLAVASNGKKAGGGGGGH